MKLKYLYLICFCCCCSLASAQNVGRIDIIILNDNSTIKGTVLNKSTEFTTIKMTSGAKIALPTNSIDTIRVGKENLFYFTNGKARKKEGYFGFAKFGVLISDHDYDREVGPTLHTVHGIRFNENLSVGMGFGVDNYSNGFNVFPLYGHVRYEPWNKKVRPYISFDAGYSFPSIDNNWSTFNGGAMLQAAIGLQFSSRSGGGFFMEFGQKFQWIKRKYDDLWWENERIESWRFSRAGITLGYHF